jgi:hypothetical protein
MNTQRPPSKYSPSVRQLVEGRPWENAPRMDRSTAHGQPSKIKLPLATLVSTRTP